MSSAIAGTREAVHSPFSVLLTTSLVSSLIMLDSNIVAITLPTIGRSLSASFRLASCAIAVELGASERLSETSASAVIVRFQGFQPQISIRFFFPVAPLSNQGMRGGGRH